jgi:hypothetical protein
MHALNERRAAPDRAAQQCFGIARSQFPLFWNARKTG